MLKEHCDHLLVPFYYSHTHTGPVIILPCVEHWAITSVSEGQAGPPSLTLVHHYYWYYIGLDSYSPINQ